MWDRPKVKVACFAVVSIWLIMVVSTSAVVTSGNPNIIVAWGSNGESTNEWGPMIGGPYQSQGFDQLTILPMAGFSADATDTFGYPLLGMNIQNVSLSLTAGAFLLDNGSVALFGNATVAGLGNHSSSSILTPSVFTLNGVNVTKVASTDTAMFMLLSNGTVLSWGRGDAAKYPGVQAGQLCQGPSVMEVYLPTPIDLGDFSDSLVHDIGCTSTSCLLLLSGTTPMVVFGSSFKGSGAFGNSSYDNDTLSVGHSTPIAVDISQLNKSCLPVSLKTYSSGIGVYFGECSDGQIWSFGYNDGFNATAQGTNAIFSLPALVPNPNNITFQTISCSTACIGLANNGSLYAWGSNMASYQFSEFYQTCNGSFCPMPFLSPWFNTSYPVIDVMNMDISTLYLTEDGNLWALGDANYTNPLPPAVMTPILLNWTSLLPPSYKLRSLSNVFAQGALTLFVASSLETCFGLRPDPSFLCLNSTWSTQVPFIATDPIVIEGPIAVTGSMTIESNITFSNCLDLSNSSSLESSCLNVSGCISFLGDAIIQLSQAQLDSLTNGTKAILWSSNCTTPLPTLSISSPASCTTVSVSSSSVNEPDGRVSLVAIFSVNTNGCQTPAQQQDDRTWWIILASVLGGVGLIVVVVVILVATNAKLRACIRPFSKRQAATGNLT